jgi:hypothetical protein
MLYIDFINARNSMMAEKPNYYVGCPTSERLNWPQDDISIQA